MPGTTKISMSRTSSGRLFRRARTDTDAVENKRCRSNSRKRFITRGRSSATSTRALSGSLSRFSTFSSRKGSDAAGIIDASKSSRKSGDDAGLDVLSETATYAASTSMTSVEDSLVSDNAIMSSTVIDIHEHQHIVDEGERRAHITDDEEEEYDSYDDFFSRLLELVPCFPHNQSHETPRSTYDFHSNFMNDFDFDKNTTKIECILEKSIDEKNDIRVPISPTINANDIQRLPSRDISLPPLSEWVQEPLLLVATPGRTNMHILRIRRVSDPSYFESPSSLGPGACLVQDHANMGNNKAIQLPINNGKEGPLYSWVIDFETNLFAGTALFRIRCANSWTEQNPAPPPLDGEFESAECDYFGKHNRKFQMVVRGKFKPNVNMADCMSGLLLDRHLATASSPSINCVDDMTCPPTVDTESIEAKATSKSKRARRLKRGKGSNDDSLPSKWALRAAVKVAGVFSPRMDADLECARPRVLSPLCSTAQTISVFRKNGTGGIPARIDETHEEPFPGSNASLVHDLHKATTKKTDGCASNFVQQRKRASDAAYDARASSLSQNDGERNASQCFDPDSEYTFEFLQHLVNYNNLSLDLGKVIGKLRLGGALRGQPIRFMAAAVNERKRDAAPNEHPLSMDDLDCLWSFDLWHKSLLPSRV